MKKKTYIKQGAFQKVENTRGVDIKGALNLNKEVLDTLVDKDVLVTTDCCGYFPTFPILENTEESLSMLPILGVAWIDAGGGTYCLATKLPNGDFAISCFGGP